MVNYQGESLNEIRKKLRPAITGTVELKTELEKILCPPNQPTNPEEKNYYRSFKLGDAESIICIHTSKNPSNVKIWFYDLLGRPAPRIVVNTISEFFKTMFNIEEAPFFDLYKNSFATVFANTFKINNESLPQDKETFAIKKIMQETITPSSTPSSLFHHIKEPTSGGKSSINTETPQKTPIK